MSELTDKRRGNIEATISLLNHQSTSDIADALQELLDEIDSLKDEIVELNTDIEQVNNELMEAQSELDNERAKNEQN